MKDVGLNPLEELFRADNVFHFIPCETLGTVQNVEEGREDQR